jgi:MoaA/NifB/PqqE/SkfB family radical SAM enzyme
MMVTSRNLGEVEQVLKLARDLGVNSFSHLNFIPTGRGSEDIQLDLNAGEREELKNLLNRWYLRKKRTGLNIFSTWPAFVRVIHERSRGPCSGLSQYTADFGSEPEGFIEYAGGCGAGRVHAAVQPTGLVTPCVCMPDVIIGDLRKKTLTDIWQESEVSPRMCDRENPESGCPEYRAVCGGCRARALACGNLPGTDPGCEVYLQVHGKEKSITEASRREGPQVMART